VEKVAEKRTRGEGGVGGDAGEGGDAAKHRKRM
jgi:hypothetical protein